MAPLSLAIIPLGHTRHIDRGLDDLLFCRLELSPRQRAFLANQRFVLRLSRLDGEPGQTLIVSQHQIDTVYLQCLCDHVILILC